MFSRSLILLASAGAAAAQLTPECERVSDVTPLLQGDDGKAYCSSVLSIGTTTATDVQSTTTTETVTITTPTQVTETFTTTQTDTVSEGTATETAATATETATLTESSTVYSCTTAFLKRRDYGEAQSTSCTKGKTTSTPTPSSTSCTKSKTIATPTPVKTSTSCTEGKQHATSVAAYGAGQPPVYSQGAVSSAQEGYHAHGSSQAAYPSKLAYDEYSAPPHPEYTSKPAYGGYSAPPYPVSTPKAYPPYPSGQYQNASSAAYQASSVHYDSYPEQSPSAYDMYPEYPVTSSIYDYYSSSVVSSSEISSSIYTPSSSIYSSEIITSSEISSSIYTPTPTPTPTPVPSCEAAPTAVQTGFACDTISTACSCLGLTSATATATTVTTVTETSSVTEAMVFTTATTLTETVFTTVPAATTTFTPSVTVTTTATATATVCPCSASQQLCGTTPDTCKDLQTDGNNCGACGNVCSSGLCNAGKCVSCSGPQTCNNFGKTCSSATGACYCMTGSSGSLGCGDLSNPSCSNYTKCSADDQCGAGAICTTSTCCGYGICVNTNRCGNQASVKRMFAPRGKGAFGNEVLGRL